jgi:hypothetical protein
MLEVNRPFVFFYLYFVACHAASYFVEVAYKLFEGTGKWGVKVVGNAF